MEKVAIIVGCITAVIFVVLVPLLLLGSCFGGNQFALPYSPGTRSSRGYPGRTGTIITYSQDSNYREIVRARVIKNDGGIG